MSKIGNRVWKAIGHNYILFGTVVEERKTNGWSMVKVEWKLPPWPTDGADEWQKIANLGCVSDLAREVNKCK
jgi:hypothetical protein